MKDEAKYEVIVPPCGHKINHILADHLIFVCFHLD